METKTGSFVWYLDDGTIVGSKKDLLSALDIIQNEAPHLGLHLNIGKSLVWSPHSDADLSGFPPNLPTKSGGGVKVLGSVVAFPEFSAEIDLSACKRVAKIEELVSRIEDLEDVQLQYLLLKYCVGMPRFNFQLRS